jgi:hypothetical protein
MLKMLSVRLKGRGDILFCMRRRIVANFLPEDNQMNLKSRIVITAIAMTILAVSVQVVKAQWTPTSGPVGGVIQVLCAAGSGIFAGTSVGGVFRSTDNGTSWTPVNSGLTDPYVMSLAVSGNNIFAVRQ